MEDTLHKAKGSKDFGVFTVQGNFVANGGSAIANSSNVGKGWTVARASAGTYTITLTNWTGSPTLLSFFACRKTTTVNDDFTFSFGAYSAANGTITLRAQTGSVATDVPAADVVGFRLEFLDSGAA